MSKKFHAYADYLIPLESLGINPSQIIGTELPKLLVEGALSALVMLEKREDVDSLLGYFHLFEDEHDDGGSGRHWVHDELKFHVFHVFSDCKTAHVRIYTTDADLEPQNHMSPPVLQCLDSLEAEVFGTTEHPLILKKYHA